MNSIEESQSELNQEIQEIKFNTETSEEIYSHIISRLDDLRDERYRMKKSKSIK